MILQVSSTIAEVESQAQYTELEAREHNTQTLRIISTTGLNRGAVTIGRAQSEAKVGETRFCIHFITTRQ
jgi:hypothetical protein